MECATVLQQWSKQWNTLDNSAVIVYVSFPNLPMTHVHLTLWPLHHTYPSLHYTTHWSHVHLITLTSALYSYFTLIPYTSSPPHPSHILTPSSFTHPHPLLLTHPHSSSLTHPHPSHILIPSSLTHPHPLIHHISLHILIPHTSSLPHPSHTSPLIPHTPHPLIPHTSSLPHPSHILTPSSHTPHPLIPHTSSLPHPSHFAPSSLTLKFMHPVLFHHSSLYPHVHSYLNTHTATSSLLLIATQEAIHYLPVPLGTHPKISRPQPLPVGPLYDVSAVAYDPVNNTVLWFDRETQFLHRWLHHTHTYTTADAHVHTHIMHTHLHTCTLHPPYIHSSHLHRATVDGRQFWNITRLPNVSVLSIAYDWVGGQVFLTKEQGFQMKLVTVNREGGDSLLFDNVQQTRNLSHLGDVVFDMDDRWGREKGSGREGEERGRAEMKVERQAKRINIIDIFCWT